MVKREKRLEKGIASIEKQIALYREKIKKFGHEKDYLEEYWEKQILDLEKRKQNREEKLRRG
jgi:hypothetical protein